MCTGVHSGGSTGEVICSLNFADSLCLRFTGQMNEVLHSKFKLASFLQEKLYVQLPFGTNKQVHSLSISAREFPWASES